MWHGPDIKVAMATSGLKGIEHVSEWPIAGNVEPHIEAQPPQPRHAPAHDHAGSWRLTDAMEISEWPLMTEYMA